MYVVYLDKGLADTGVRARRDFGEDSKEQYKFYLNLRVYSSCRVQDVA